MTNPSFRPFALMALFALLGIGCGADCESLCEDSQNCEGSQIEDVNCANYCKTLEELNEKARCEDQYADLISCSSNQDDVCKADGCVSESKTYGDCQNAYCVKPEHAAECEKL